MQNLFSQNQHLQQVHSFLITLKSVSIVLFCVSQIISYNKYTGPYAANDFTVGVASMKLWNQKNETCKFQYDGYSKLSCK